MNPIPVLIFFVNIFFRNLKHGLSKWTYVVVCQLAISQKTRQYIWLFESRSLWFVENSTEIVFYES